jgi:hypothetical protein
VTLALIDDDGAVLGALPPFDVEIGWWQETASVVAGARELFGVEVAVLRLLHGEQAVPPGGAVTYLAQVNEADGATLSPIDVDLSEQPNRADYARLGGPAASLDWAAERLEELELGPIGSAVQQRTWNLSAIWRLESAAGTLWLKQVPRFFAHESAVLRWLAAQGFGLTSPMQLASDGLRMLLADLPGEDLYHAHIDVLQAIAATHHEVQVTAAAQVPRLLGLGVPDLRASRLTEVITQITAGYAESNPALADLVTGLPDRWAAVEECGLPDTLVHGDLHPGNARGDHTHQVVLDWGDSFVGHPAFDILRLAGWTGEPDASALIDAWVARWQDTVPGSDPLRAVKLLQPVAALRSAACYAQFLAQIEPAERPYHEADVPFWLDKAIAA